MAEHYQVLARKYRPHTFDEMVGQVHTVQTLKNALDANSLHHGFLFTGTRGVGKTTIARIFAKSINCEQGVSSKPCGKCPTCLEIDQGRSVDLIELDAASNTQVDKMRDLLENAQYMPTKNRYKIYLIDEVHMLSQSSFNALLKTLEEPPEHIKFLLATTDPQKLPVTVLSRCLQFTLQKLTHDEILSQMEFIMKNEGLEYEPEALSQIADLGNGSMRDALSLLDQSISYGNGKILNEDIKAMLGLVRSDDVISLAKHVIARDAEGVLTFTKELAHRGENLEHALKDLSTLFHQMMVEKLQPNNQNNADIKSLSKQISDYDLQLFYQMAINGTKDMSLAPSEQIGFEMTLLRMITFVQGSDTPTEKKTAKITPKPDKKPSHTTPKVSSLKIENQQDWQTIYQSLGCAGAVSTLIKNTVFKQFDGNHLSLSLDEKMANLLTDQTQIAIQDTLEKRFGKITLSIDLEKPKTQTLADKEAQQRAEKLAKIQQTYLKDEGVKKLEKIFNAKVDIKSIKEVDDV